MGCVSSAFLEDDEHIISPSLGHHIVSLTSTTYGLLTTLDQPPPQTPPTPTPPPPPPPPPPSSSTRFPLHPLPEVINSWELMAGLDPITPTKSPIPLTPKPFPTPHKDIINSLRALHFSDPLRKINIPRPSNAAATLDMFEKRCPPGGEEGLVLYTTTLRGIRKTFEDCNAVRSAIEGLGVWVRERDVSMDLGFREELRELMKGTGEGPTVPKLFVRGRYIGGVEKVLRINEEGRLAGLLEGLPRARFCGPCDGCGGVRFLPCFQCSGSRKVVVVVVVAKVEGRKGGGEEKGKVVRCPECNENGLVVCPICY